jgi:hypothetical protein
MSSSGVAGITGPPTYSSDTLSAFALLSSHRHPLSSGLGLAFLAVLEIELRALPLVYNLSHAFSLA